MAGREVFAHFGRTRLTFVKADSLRFYIDWAIEHGMAVIDVNVPKYLSDQDVSRSLLLW